VLVDQRAKETCHGASSIGRDYRETSHCNTFLSVDRPAAVTGVETTASRPIMRG